MSASSPNYPRLGGNKAEDYPQEGEMDGEVPALCEGEMKTGPEPAGLGESMTYECLGIPMSLHSNVTIVSRILSTEWQCGQ